MTSRNRITTQLGSPTTQTPSLLYHILTIIATSTISASKVPLEYGTLCRQSVFLKFQSTKWSFVTDSWKKEKAWLLGIERIMNNDGWCVLLYHWHPLLNHWLVVEDSVLDKVCSRYFTNTRFSSDELLFVHDSTSLIPFFLPWRPKDPYKTMTVWYPTFTNIPVTCLPPSIRCLSHCISSVSTSLRYTSRLNSAFLAADQ